MQIKELSYSSFNEYANFCPLKYYYRKILGLEPEFISCEMVYGSGFHSALEQHYIAMLEGKSITFESMVDVFAASFDNPKIRYNGQTRDELIYEGAELLNLGRNLNLGKVTGVEVPFEVKLADDLTLTGFIDLLVIDKHGRRCIIDFKTAKKRPSLNDVENHHQLSTYNLAYPDSYMKLVVFLKQKKPDVECFDTTRELADRKRMVKMYLAVKQAIESGCFYPREGYWCGGCGYRDKCKQDF